MIMAKLYDSKKHMNEAVNMINIILPTASSKTEVYRRLANFYMITLIEFVEIWPKSKKELRANLSVRMATVDWIHHDWVKPKPAVSKSL